MSDPDDITDLAALRDQLDRLAHTRDPATRNQLAVDLIAAAPRILRDIRRQAARDAVDAGMRPSEYARAIGVSAGAVDHLLHADRGTGRGHAPRRAES